MMHRRILAAIMVVLLSRSVPAEVFVFHHENVLGTSCELTLECQTSSEARRAEHLALQEIDRLSGILSSHDRESEWMRLQRAALSANASVFHLSDELRDVLERAEHWRKTTEGAFDLRAGALTDLWKTASANGRIPSAEERLNITRQLGQPPYRLTKAGVQWKSELAMSLDGLAKGYILDSVTEQLIQAPGVNGCCLNIGGDLRKRGEWAQTVSISDPSQAMEGASPLLTLQTDGDFVLATSGNYRRQFHVAGRQYSHILDPRSGLSVEHVTSASVLAPRAIDSDALATALSVMPAEAGLELVAKLSHVECALVLAGGKVVLSRGCPKEHSQPHYVSDTEKKPAAGLIVDFSLNRPEGRRYRRPYVAVWLEDSDGFPVKTSVLWIQTEQPGPRWHRDLTRWFRNDRMRKIVEKTNMIGTVSGATRGPGEYQAVFDGTDNAGKRLPPGKYTLCLEVAREHGTYQIIREPLELSGKSIAPKELKGNVEMNKVSYKYIPIAPQATEVQ